MLLSKRRYNGGKKRRRVESMILVHFRKAINSGYEPWDRCPRTHRYQDNIFLKFPEGSLQSTVLSVELDRSYGAEIWKCH